MNRRGKRKNTETTLSISTLDVLLKVNGKEIGDYVSGVSINVDGSDIMKVNLEIPASSFYAYCDLEIKAEKV